MFTNYRKSGAASKQPAPIADDPVTLEVIGSPYYYKRQGGDQEKRVQEVLRNFYGKDEPKEEEATEEGFPVSPRRTMISP